MAVSKQRVAELVKEFGSNEKDTGSTAVQIALITEQINLLAAHMKGHEKDFHSNRGLLVLVGKRRSLLEYLKKEDYAKYEQVVTRLNIRK